MSSILKALKKLEEEKTQRRPALLHIDSDILRPGEEKRRFSPISMGALALLLFIGGSVATYLLMTRLLPSPRSADRPAVQQGPVRQSTAPAPPPAVPYPPAIPVEPLPAEIVVMPATPAARIIGRQPRRQTGLKAITPLPPATAHVPVSLPESTTVLPQAPPIGPAVPQLRVNGIAFQKEGAETMAIVNGTPVSVGSIVQGAKVEEITIDRVRLRYHGEMLEILLGQSNR